MASVVTERRSYKSAKTGKETIRTLYRVDFTHPNTGKRESIRFGGTLTKKGARDFAGLLEDLIELRTSKKENAAVTDWLRDMDAATHAKLVQFGLTKPRADSTDRDLMEFIDKYIASRTDVTERTRTNYRQARGFIAEFLTEQVEAHREERRTLKSFTKADAKAFRNWLLTKNTFQREDRPQAENYVRTQCKNLKLFFGAAVDARLIPENPFKDKSIPCRVQPRPERLVFVSAEDVRKLLEACPDIEYKLVIALARWGGLRMPSELDLKWEHINWEHMRMVIPQPKVKRYGKPARVTPLFPELVPLLMEAQEQAPPGSVYVVPRLRGESKNLRTMLEKICIRAGVVPWQKPFQNLRATRATELADEYPLKVVSEWLGHDVMVSLKHYQQVRAEHWDKAIKGSTNSAQHLAQQHHQK